jgi:hypothetical protein
MKQRIDEARLRRTIFTLLGVIAGVVLVVMAFCAQSPVVMAAVVGIPFLIPFFSRTDQLYVFMTLATASGLSLPGMKELDVGLVFQAALVGMCVLSLAMSPRSSMDSMVVPRWAKRSAFAFLFVVFVIMGVRGAGLRIFGESTWGGAPYIYITLSVLFLVSVVPRVRLSRKQIRYLVFGGFIISIFSSLGAHAGFVEQVSESSGPSVGAARLSWLLPIAYATMPLVAALNLRRFVRWGLMGLVVLLVAASGFRSKMVGVMIVFWFFEWCRSRDKKRFFGRSLLVGLVAWVVVIAVSSSLPIGMQRAVSFVPGARVDVAVAQSAEGSVEWRLEIWKEAMSHFDEYWLIGRGVTFDVYGFIDQMGAELGQGLNSTLFGYLSHNYHSGPVTMLIDFGVPATVLLLFFMLISGRCTIQISHKVMHQDTFESRYLLFLCMNLLWKYFSFWAVFGGKNDLVGFFMMFAALLIVSRSLLTEFDGRELGAGR